MADDGIRMIARRARRDAEGSLERGAGLDAILAKACTQRRLDIAVDTHGILGEDEGRLIRDAQGDGRGTILVAKSLSPERSRHVIAHELGHFDLHDSRLEIRAIAYSAAGSPRFDTGYSSRSLVEKQADAFAAEFLCPLSETTFEDFSPLASATNIGLEPTLVLRQAIRALLPERCAERFELPPMRDEQTLALDHTGADAVVIGEPSTGKTTLIAAKAISLLKGGTPASAIAIVAFSDQAADRLRRMIASSFPTEAAVLWCGTQTAFAFEVVACHAERAGLPLDFGVLDPTAAINLLKKTGLPTSARGDLRRLTAGLSRRRKGGHAFDGTPDLVLDVVEALYAQGKKLGGVADRDDLFETACELVGEASGVCRRLAKRFHHMLIDDIQDLRRETIEIATLMSRAGSRVFGAGNTVGSIRAFDGASPDAVASIQTKLQAARFDLRGRDTSIPVLKPRLNPTRRARVEASNDVTLLAESIRTLAMRGIAVRDQAILVRTNARAKALARELRRADIPVLHFGEFAERCEVLDLCAVASLEDPDLDVARWALDRLTKLPPYRAVESDIAKLLAIAKRRRTNALATLRTGLVMARLSPQGRIGLATLAAHMRALSPQASTWTTLSVWLFERSSYLKTLDNASSAEAALARLAIVHTLNVCEIQDALGETGGAALLARLKVAGTIDGLGGLATVDIGSYDIDAVRIMTVHAAQGQHFAAVHLPMMKPDRSARSSGHQSDEDAMLRIALSRAHGWCLPVSSSSKGDLTWPATPGSQKAAGTRRFRPSQMMNAVGTGSRRR